MVSVPAEIDGRKVDASKAPILLHLDIGGYIAASEAGTPSTVGFAPLSGHGIDVEVVERSGI
ncbi:hypothetical protein [Streptomyces sp. 061-3]|uniref:hypothetical protein n=1 Tax=Streptomyces sp. 061-3 TaxID=2789268 RepID=UPI003981477B